VRLSAPGLRLLADALGLWQTYDKPAAMPQPAMDLDRPLALVNNGVYGRQAKPVSLPGFLRGKERLKKARQCCAAHAAAVIGDLQLHLAFELAGFDSHSATLWHRVPRIEHKIKNNLLRLRGIHPDFTEITSQTNLQNDVFADEPREKITHL